MPFLLFIIALFFIFFTPIKNMVSRANRNNNPGNLRYAGQAGTTGQDSNGFAVFASLDLGWNALVRQWTLYANRGYTLAEGITRYAPNTENNTNAYLNFLANRLGVDPSMPLSAIDLNALAQAVAKYEGFINI